MMKSETNRLLLEFEQLLRVTNREVISSEINVVSLDELNPVIKLVARARAAYLKRLYEIANEHDEGQSMPTKEEMQELRQLHLIFNELVEGSKSIETAIQRGYLEIKP